MPPQEMLRHSKAGLVGPVVHTRFCFSRPSSAYLVGMEFASKHDFTPPTIFLELLLCPWTWGIFFFFFGGIQHSPVDGCSAASCILEFSQEKMSTRPSSLPFCHLGLKIYWAWPCPSEQDPVSHSQSLHSVSFHKPCILISQRADRMKTTITEN